MQNTPLILTKSFSSKPYRHRLSPTFLLLSAWLMNFTDYKATALSKRVHSLLKHLMEKNPTTWYIWICHKGHFDPLTLSWKYPLAQRQTNKPTYTCGKCFLHWSAGALIYLEVRGMRIPAGLSEALFFFFLEELGRIQWIEKELYMCIVLFLKTLKYCSCVQI